MISVNYIKNCIFHNVLKQFLKIRYITSSSVNYSRKKFNLKFSNGQKLSIETGLYARMADGAASVTVGNTTVLATAVSKTRVGSASFVPLTVNYKIKHAGSLQSSMTRFGFATMENEVLTSRAIDRSVRPLFPAGFSYDTQITCQLMAVDGFNEPDVAGINAASAALAISDIPWHGPLGAVRVGLISGEVVVFPTRRQLHESAIDLIVAGTGNDLAIMLEGAAQNITHADLITAITVGMSECQKIVDGIKDLAEQSQVIKRELELSTETSDEINKAIKLLCENKLEDIFTDFSHDKLSRDNSVKALLADAQMHMLESFPEVEPSRISNIFNKLSKNTFRNLILDKETRCDGRNLTDLRKIDCSINLLKPLHGSSLFQRGQTQVQTTVTLDAPMNQNRVDSLLESIGGVRERNFILGYNFPSYAVNEVSKAGMVSRREIGHGALAEKALKPLIPISNEYSVSLNTTVMESNGSSSMATVCGGSLALMDAGVNISYPASGVAVGLITRYDQDNNLEKYKLLTDLLGIEDYLGDMDFKIAGTCRGITALQLDVKVPGIPVHVVDEALKQGTVGINEILNIMAKTINSPRGKGEKQDVMPVIKTIECPIHQRSRLYGIKGIRKIQSETGVQITWLEETKLSIFAPNQCMMDEALEYLSKLLSKEPELEFGAIYEAVITEILTRGIFVTLYDGMPPIIVHNSQLDSRKVKDAHVLNFEVGQTIQLKYFGRDPATGRIRLSRRVLQVAKDTVKNLTPKPLS